MSVEHKPKASTGWFAFWKLRKSWLVAFGFLLIGLAAGFLIGSVQQLLGTSLQPSSCPVDPRGVVTTDCVSHRMLLATEVGAKATRIYMWLTFIGLIVSFLTLIGLFYTLGLNRKALDAAIEANAVSDRNGKVQVRSYLVVENTIARLARDGGLWVQPNFVNSGQSPACQIRWCARARVQWEASDQTQRVSFTDLDMNMDGSVWLQEIAAHHPMLMPILRMPLNDVPDLLPNSGNPCPVAVEILVQYLDVFGEQHEIKTSFVGFLPIRDQGNDNYTKLERATDDYFQKLLGDAHVNI